MESKDPRGKWVPIPEPKTYIERVASHKCSCGNSYDVGLATHIHKHLGIRPGRNELMLPQVCSKCGDTLNWKWKEAPKDATPTAG